MDYWQLLLLGSIAGFTIFLGLPVAALQHLSIKKKGFLNAFAIGILLFLLVDIMYDAMEVSQEKLLDSLSGQIPYYEGIIFFFTFFIGIGTLRPIGLHRRRCQGGFRRR